VLALRVRVVYQDAEGMDVHWYLEQPGASTRVGALYWLNPSIKPQDLVQLIVLQMKGLDREAVGGEEETCKAKVPPPEST